MHRSNGGIGMKTVFPCAQRASVLLTIVLGIGGCAPRFRCPPKPAADPRAQAFAEQGGKSSSRWGQTGPQDAQIAIDPSCSTYCYEFFGDGWQAPVFGTIDVTIDPNCTAPTCTLTMDKIQLTTGDVTLPGHSLTDVVIAGTPVRYQRGLWSTDNVFYMDQYFNTYTKFKLDGVAHTQVITGTGTGPIGTLDRDYGNFSMSGELIRAENLAINLSLCGHPIDRPPIPVITPVGTILTDSPGIAHVTFSAEQSTDAESKVRVLDWRLDNISMEARGAFLSATLDTGPHTVSVRVSDSRMVERTATEQIMIQER